MKKHNLLILSLLLSLTLTQCKKDTIDTTPKFNATKIPTDVTKLFEQRGDSSNDTVWVYVQGGPVIERSYELEEGPFPFFTDNLRVYPFQVQNLNPEIKTSKEFSFEDAKIESSKTADIVKTVVEHFKSQNKIVYLIGHSYGSFVVHEVLAKYGSIAERTLSLNGRLDMDKTVWEGFARGEEWLFNEEGVNPKLFKKAEDRSVVEQNMSKIAAGLGYKRYSEELVDTDLSDVIFVTATHDKYVGDFTPEVIDFLEPKAGATVIIPKFGHSDIFIPSSMKVIHDLMIQKK